MKPLLRFFFHLLYHQFAFTYDVVAAAVSFNRWRSWVESVVPFIVGTRVLEIGHGPGHLQRLLRDRGLPALGLDESAQMGRLARRNLRRSLGAKPGEPGQVDQRSAYTQTGLTRGRAEALPFPDESFDTVVATFPTEYITDPATLAEIQRCLRTGGRLVVLPVALPKNRLLDWLFKVTHQRPAEAVDLIRSRLPEPFRAAGFETEVRALDAESGILLIVLAHKT